MKLVTTFAALELLGPDYRWKTEAYLGGPLVEGELHGDLILKGYGDPKITVEQWQSFMTTLRAGGLNAVDGDLALDRSRFALPPYDPAAFDHEPLKPYNVGPDALLVNFKSLKLTLAPDATGGGRRRAVGTGARRSYARVRRLACPPTTAAIGGCALRRRSRMAATAAASPSPARTRRAAANATGGSRCSTTRTTCAQCSKPTFARPEDALRAA